MDKEKFREEKDEFEDDGRVIAPMDVDGMPWGGRMAAGSENAAKDPKFRDLNIAGGLHGKSMNTAGGFHGKNMDGTTPLDDLRYEEAVSKEDRKWYIFGTMKAALLIGGAFGVGFLIFILFCVLVWFR